MPIRVPIKVLHEAEGHIVTLETITGEVYRGKLIEAEDYMNLSRRKNCKLGKCLYSRIENTIPHTAGYVEKCTDVQETDWERWNGGFSISSSHCLRIVYLVGSKNSLQYSTVRNNAESEEIIAEDYDDVEDPSQYDIEPVRKPQSFWIERMKRRIGETSAAGYKGCPNKNNVYHKCSVYCMNRWGDGILEPKRSYIRRRNRLLKLYPLPKNWLEVYDYGCAVHYYWNTTNDMVSWLPPGHPKSLTLKCAAVMRRELEESQSMDAEGETVAVGDTQKLLDESVPAPNWRQNTPSPEPTPLPRKKAKSRDLDKAVRHNRTKKIIRSSGVDDLDPMDPAAYSDIPRGKWSDGLADITSVKSGVDPSTSGALFQMRPYPSPGDVLQRNSDRKTSRIFSPQSE